MRVKKGNVEFEPTPTHRCKRLPSRPLMTDKMCQLRGAKLDFFEECVGCKRTIRRIPKK